MARGRSSTMWIMVMSEATWMAILLLDGVLMYVAYRVLRSRPIRAALEEAGRKFAPVRDPDCGKPICAAGEAA